MNNRQLNLTIVIADEIKNHGYTYTPLTTVMRYNMYNMNRLDLY